MSIIIALFIRIIIVHFYDVETEIICHELQHEMFVIKYYKNIEKIVAPVLSIECLPLYGKPYILFLFHLQRRRSTPTKPAYTFTLP